MPDRPRELDAVLNVRLPSAMLRALQDAAAAERRPLATYVRLLLERAMEPQRTPRRTGTVFARTLERRSR